MATGAYTLPATAIGGKFEGRIKVPTGGWDIALNENSSSVGTATIPAGDYYMSSGVDAGDSFLDEIKTQFEATGAGTYTTTMDTVTGKVTISATGITDFDATWSDTEVRDVLGFDQGNISGADEYEGDSAARSVYIPLQCASTLSDSTNWRGWHEVDLHQLESPSGYVYSLSGERKIVMDMKFEAIRASRVWVQSEYIVNESFERFYLDCIYGEGIGATPGGPVRWHSDVSVNGTYGTYYVLGMRTWKPEFVQEGWAGRYTLRLPRLVLHPDDKASAT